MYVLDITVCSQIPGCQREAFQGMSTIIVVSSGLRIDLFTGSLSPCHLSCAAVAAAVEVKEIGSGANLFLPPRMWKEKISGKEKG